MPLGTPASLDQNVAPDDLIPNNAIFTSINMLSSSPNFGTANVQISSMQSSVRFALCISQASISRSFNTEIVKSILNESLDTTDDNLIEEGVVVVPFS